MASNVDRNIVLETYKEVIEKNPYAILRDVEKALADKGIKNPSTGKPYSHSTIHYALQRFPEAQQIKGDKNTRDVRIVVRMALFPLISQWLASNITKAIVVDEKDLTREMVKGKWLYGWAKPDILLACGKVWWPFIPRKGAVTEDMELDNSTVFHAIDITLKY